MSINIAEIRMMYTCIMQYNRSHINTLHYNLKQNIHNTQYIIHNIIITHNIINKKCIAINNYIVYQ